MTIEEAIKYCEEVVIKNDKLCKRYDDASGYSRSHDEAIRTTDAKRCEECAEEHRQLAKWLKKYKEMLLAIEEIKSLGKSRRILLIKGDEVLSLVEDIIDKHTSEKEGE